MLGFICSALMLVGSAPTISSSNLHPLDIALYEVTASTAGRDRFDVEAIVPSACDRLAGARVELAREHRVLLVHLQGYRMSADCAPSPRRQHVTVRIDGLAEGSYRVLDFKSFRSLGELTVSRDNQKLLSTRYISRDRIAMASSQP